MSEHEPAYTVKTEGYWTDLRCIDAIDHLIAYESDMNAWVYVALVCVEEADRDQALQSRNVQRCIDLACE